MKQEIEVEPLTRFSPRTGKALVRRLEVEEHIKEILPLDPDDLRRRLEETDFNQSGYVKSECLIYLLRHYQKLGHYDTVSDLATVLTARVTPTIDRHISFVSPNRKDECLDEIVTSIILPVIDMGTDSGDYAQVSFGQWVKYHILDAVEKYFLIQNKENRTDSLTRAEDDEAEEEVEANGADSRIGDLRPEEYSVFRKSALSLLSENERKAFLMRHSWGLEIENRDPAVLTLSRHFGVTPRTINNWLNNAEKKLAKWRDQRGA